MFTVVVRVCRLKLITISGVEWDLWPVRLALALGLKVNQGRPPANTSHPITLVSRSSPCMDEGNNRPSKETVTNLAHETVQVLYPAMMNYTAHRSKPPISLHARNLFSDYITIVSVRLLKL